jgi:alpha-L-fucosidase
VLPPINAKVLKNSLLTGGSGTVRQTDAGVEIAVAQEHRRPIDTIVVLELDGPALAIPPVAVRWASRSLACGKKATASNVFRNMKQHGPDKAFDDDPETRWATGAGTKQAWLEVDLGETVTIDRARIEEWDRRVRQFTLECRLDGQWQVLHKGSGLGAEADIRFKPVAARYVRLNILRASEGPTIKELQLFGPGQAKATPR